MKNQICEPKMLEGGSFVRSVGFLTTKDFVATQNEGMNEIS